MPPVPAPAQGPHQSVGLVLSGGGARGIAHIGMLQAFEDNDIPVDYITGTSMGAIVGGLYACGYSPAEMMQLIESEYFNYMAQGKDDPRLTYYFVRPKASSEMFSVSLGRTDSTVAKVFNPQSLIAPGPMNFGFMQIFAAYTAQCGGDYNRLFVPFRCVASDATKKEKHVFSHGQLEKSIRASMSFPLVFQAQEIDGQVFYDGGIYDNFPVGVMQSDFKPDFIIGSDVSASSSGPANSLYQQLELLMTNTQSYDVPSADGIKIRMPVTGFGLLDWDKAQAIYQAGYDKAMAMMDSIKGRVVARTPAATRTARRAAFKAATKPLRFGKVEVSGGSRRQNEFLDYLFEPAKGCDTIGVDRARLAYYRALSSGKLSQLNVDTHIDSPESDLYTLNVEARAKSRFSAGAGAFITSSNNSYLYLRGGYSSLNFSSFNSDIEAWIGQSYMAGAFNGSITLASGTPSRFIVQAVASRRRYQQNDEFFFRDKEPAFVNNHEYFARLGWAMAAGRSGKTELGLGMGKLRHGYYMPAVFYSLDHSRRHVDYVLGQVYMGYEASTLNHINYPTSGTEFKAKAAGLLGKVHDRAALDGGSKRRAWVQLDAQCRSYLPLHRHWALGLEGNALLSTRKLLGSYDASISSAPAFTPTPASDNSFNPAFHANSYVAAALVPVYKYNSSLSARFSANIFVPLRPITTSDDGSARYGHWFGTCRFFGELDLVYALPFGNIAAYGNYASTPGRFNAGISLGIYLPAPRFL